LINDKIVYMIFIDIVSHSRSFMRELYQIFIWVFTSIESLIMLANWCERLGGVVVMKIESGQRRNKITRCNASMVLVSNIRFP
jgi:hypothetical protein